MLRPLRLTPFNPEPSEEHIQEIAHVDTSSVETSGRGTHEIESSPVSLFPELESEPDIPPGDAEAQQLLKRTPANYLINQMYGFWVYASLFFLTLITTRNLPMDQYGVFVVALAAFNTIAYIVALGLEDATTTFVPRVLSEHGKAAAASLIRRLLLLRIAILVLSIVIMIFALPILATLIALIPIDVSAKVAAGLRNPTLLTYIFPIAINVFGNGLGSLFNAICASFMRMRLVFVIGSITQGILLALGFPVLFIGWGVNGLLWLYALAALLSALAYLPWLAPLLLTRGATYKQPLKPVITIGISAWLTNLISSALLKQVSIILLGYFLISITEVGYFNLSFQLADAASTLLVTGFGGVAGAALAAAFVGKNYPRLAYSWQALIKIETLLAAPVLIFCLFNAQSVTEALVGSNYRAVGPLLAIFLSFNIVVRLLGSTINQYALYVTGRPQLVVLSQWIGLFVVILVGIALVPHMGAAGALIADGFAKVIIGGLMLVFLWRSLPRKYPLGFTLRMVAGFTIAALPSILWHPSGHLLLILSGIIYLLLSVGLLLLIKPLSAEDVEMLQSLNPRVGKHLRWFARNNA